MQLKKNLETWKRFWKGCFLYCCCFYIVDFYILPSRHYSVAKSYQIIDTKQKPLFAFDQQNQWRGFSYGTKHGTWDTGHETNNNGTDRITLFLIICISPNIRESIHPSLFIAHLQITFSLDIANWFAKSYSFVPFTSYH